MSTAFFLNEGFPWCLSSVCQASSDWFDSSSSLIQDVCDMTCSGGTGLYILYHVVDLSCTR